MLAQLIIGQAGQVVDLQPLQPARGQIGRGADAGLILQDLKGNVRRFEGKGIAPVIPAADGKDLAAHFPHIGIAPLHDMGGGGEGLTELIEFIAGHGRDLRRLTGCDKSRASACCQKRVGAFMLKWIDIPPMWLLGFAALAWVQASYYPFGLGFGGAWADFAGGVLVGGGLVLMAMAFAEFRRHRTTVIPHQEAERLITSGIFKRSRNPIYLGDSLILLGLILRWDAVLALPLVPLFVWVIEKRFIIAEEDRLRRKFRRDFAHYCQKTRRWL